MAAGGGNGYVIRRTALRAPFEFQLELTDAIVVNERVSAGESPTTTWLRRRFPGPVLQAVTVPAEDAAWLKGLRVVAWAGIGAPQRFFAMLEALGAEVAEKVPFRDHQQLGEADARNLLEIARRQGATLVTTEKDMVRLAGSSGLLAELAAESRMLPVKLSLAEPDGERLSTLINAAVKGGRVTGAGSAGFAPHGRKRSKEISALRRLLQLDAPIAQIRQHDRFAGHRAANEVARAQDWNSPRGNAASPQPLRPSSFSNRFIRWNLILQGNAGARSIQSDRGLRKGLWPPAGRVSHTPVRRIHVAKWRVDAGGWQAWTLRAPEAKQGCQQSRFILNNHEHGASISCHQPAGAGRGSV